MSVKELLSFPSHPTDMIAGIGSRRCPGSESKLLFKMVVLATLTQKCGFSSGGAPGMDTTTEHAVRCAIKLISESQEEYRTLLPNYLHVYLPDRFFNGRNENMLGMINAAKLPNHDEARSIAFDVHPALKSMKNPPDFVVKLHSRNGHQALGMDLNSPVRSVFCYTPDGAKGNNVTSKTGGTGQALRLAQKHGIPVINIGGSQDHQKMQRWVEKQSSQLKELTGIDLDRETHRYYSEFTAGMERYDGDLVSDVGHIKPDIMVQGCNCYNKMGSGLAKSIRDEFPEAYAADLKTVTGDKSKLGTYTSADIAHPAGDIKIINAYTQFNYGKDGALYFDYDAFKTILENLNKNFPGKRVAFPRIGADLAGGCWLTIAEMIKNKAKNIHPVIVFRPEDLEYTPGVQTTPTTEKPRQGSLDI